MYNFLASAKIASLKFSWRLSPPQDVAQHAYPAGDAPLARPAHCGRCLRDNPGGFLR